MLDIVIAVVNEKTDGGLKRCKMGQNDISAFDFGIAPLVYLPCGLTGEVPMEAVPAGR